MRILEGIKVKIIKIVFFVLFIIYICSYLFLSSFGKREAVGANGNTIWAFAELRMNFHIPEPGTYWYKKELTYKILYYPLIKIDRYIFDNYHILEPELPDIGG